ncbi:MAG: hypothetical protein ACOY41_08750 [Pseudomonadota bacterium]
MFRQLTLIALLALFVGVARAEFSYDYIQAGFGEVDDDAEALFAGGSKSIDRNLFILGSLFGVDSDYGVEGMYLEAGLGYAMPLTPEADLFVNGQVLYANFDVSGDDDDIGGIARAGVRFMPMSKVELEGAAAMSSNDLLIDDGFGLDASARYYFDQRFSAALGFSKDTELDGMFVNVRYHFQ